MVRHRGSAGGNQFDFRFAITRSSEYEPTANFKRTSVSFLMDYAANQAFPRRRMIGDCDIDASANGPGVGDRAISDPRVCSNWLAVPASVVRHYRSPGICASSCRWEGVGDLPGTPFWAAGAV